MQTRSASAATASIMKQPKRKREEVVDDSDVKITTRGRGRPRKTPRSPPSEAKEETSPTPTSEIQLKKSSSPVPQVKVEAASQQRQTEGSPSAAKTLSEKKYAAWSKHATSSPYPDFPRPTPEECWTAHDILERLHGDVVRENFADPDAPSLEYPYAMDALVVAALSQATSWANAKRAMKSMKAVYGSTFNYEAIVEGGMDKLVDALRPGGMQNRKAKILMRLLHDVKERHGKWDLQHLFNASDEEAVKEVVSYWGLGPKCAFCLLSICLKRDAFAVDTHIYRITGLWGWRPKDASKELAQAHLDARIPNEIKYALHYQFIVHGRQCPACRGNGDSKARCEYKVALKEVEKKSKGCSLKKEEL
ncbi:Putative HhH-GPD domain, DNA glycosylase, helix-hairpin-helix, base-excision DNA repair [Colletotrichum destructivum]|uniref:HhH-GPD domain, DNA glycosylase, helix-hairpin-helix, base-excision DNA repair n=1 Tax=Colletotrichum destructivum TaxID=34406 RepID=A0AAX4I5R1_9PEZI|nr:Putative HhH-GPD domain, DNA glycosylase, helix-hairpin-helix, base-excision DNA repair [Colletotrichum destructivum]